MKNQQVKAYNNIEFLNSPEARTIRMLAEYLEPLKRFKEHHVEDTVVFFGSARIRPPEVTAKRVSLLEERLSGGSSDEQIARKLELEQAKRNRSMSTYYTDAVRLSSLITAWARELGQSQSNNNRRLMVCSGGGPGIMEAANRGAREAGGSSIALNISLPFEQETNDYCDKELAFEFHYFFIRKFWFVYPAKACVIFPGGYGTIDEMMELLTLIQTGKTRKSLPVVLYGSKFWSEIINFDGLVRWGLIDRKDLELFRLCDTPEEAFEHIKRTLEPTL